MYTILVPYESEGPTRFPTGWERYALAQFSQDVHGNCLNMLFIYR
jgi:hypothetical protein